MRKSREIWNTLPKVNKLKTNLKLRNYKILRHVIGLEVMTIACVVMRTTPTRVVHCRENYTCCHDNCSASVIINYIFPTN